MCVVCGCSTGTPGAQPSTGASHVHEHRHENGEVHNHAHHHPEHDARHGHGHDHTHAHPHHDHAHDQPAHVESIRPDGAPQVDAATGDLHYGAGSAHVRCPA